MSTTKYFVNGQAYDYEDLEHFGYTTFPTNPTDFLLCEIGANFGTYDATQGYAYIDQVGSEIDGYEYNATYFYPVQLDGWGYWYDINWLATLGVAPLTSLMVWLLDSTNTPVKSLSVTTNGEGSARYFIANEIILDDNNDTVYWFAESELSGYGFSYPQCYVQLAEIPIDDPDVAVDYLEMITGMSYADASAAIYAYVNSGYTTGIGGLKNSLDAALFARLWNENYPSAEAGGTAEVVIASIPTSDYGYMTDSSDLHQGTVAIGTFERSKIFVRYDQNLIWHNAIYGTIEIPVPKNAYMRSAAYQTSNKSLTANSSNFLYGPGADATLQGKPYNAYVLDGAYTNGNVSVALNGARLELVQSGSVYSLKLVWGSVTANVCYVKYFESAKQFRAYTTVNASGFGHNRTLFATVTYDTYEFNSETELASYDNVTFDNVHYYDENGAEVSPNGNYSGAFYNLTLTVRNGIVCIANTGSGYVPVSCVDFTMVESEE